MSTASLSDQEIQRRETLEKLREYGIDPYPAALYPVSHKALDIKENYKEGEKVIVAGRLMRRKIQGKASLIVMKFVKEKTSRCTMMYSRKCFI